MELRYSTRSKFFDAIETALRAAGDLTKTVHVQLPPGGYNRDVKVEIRGDNPHTFWSNWEGKDPTRFSARIRAAAAVLQRRNLNGCFHIVHEDGSLAITKLK